MRHHNVRASTLSPSACAYMGKRGVTGGKGPGGWLISATGLVTSHPLSPYNTDNGRPTTIKPWSFTLLKMYPSLLGLDLKFPTGGLLVVSSFHCRLSVLFACLLGQTRKGFSPADTRITFAIIRGKTFSLFATRNETEASHIACNGYGAI